MDDRSYVKYRGMRVNKDWVEEIKRAQEHSTYLINGEVYERIAYGEETGLSGRPTTPCPGCAVRESEYHVSGCEYERCPACLQGALECFCTYQND